MNTQEKRTEKACDCTSKFSKRAKRISRLLIPKADQNWLLYK
ncbi:hypothetical protein [Christiangramia fulva]|nr:hypothetical protein [Christiangramia fulva]